MIPLERSCTARLSSVGQGADANCCDAGSSPFYRIDTDVVTLDATGGSIRYVYSAQAIPGGNNAGDWYDIMVQLLRKETGGRQLVLEGCVDYRGENVDGYRGSFEITRPGNYFVRFVVGSYDRSNGGLLGAEFQLHDVVYTPN